MLPLRDLPTRHLVHWLLWLLVAGVACQRFERAGPPSGNPVFPGVCLASDPDVPRPIPAHAETVACVNGEPRNSDQRLFAADGPSLPDDFVRVHQVCRLLDPATGTRDHERAEVLAAERELFGFLLERPALHRAMGGLNEGPQARLQALSRIWLSGNAFEHVFCGERNAEGGLGGFHLWSEYYYAEQTGKADYHCSVEGLDDDQIATFRFSYSPRDDALLKPKGGFHVGMSPACLLAIGYLAATHGVTPSSGVRSAFQVGMYGRLVDWVFWQDSAGNLLTIFPLASDAPGVGR